MTKQEFKQVYDLLDAVYELNFEPRKLDVWYETLKTMSYEKAMLAANRYIATEKYKLKPADIIRIATEVRPAIKNQPDFKCELCSGGFIGAEKLIDTSEGPQPIVYYYRCKCSIGLANCGTVPIITDDIINSRHRDIFGVYRIKQSQHTEVKREDMRRMVQNFGKW